MQDIAAICREISHFGSVAGIVQLAYQFGPFLFGFVFIFLVTPAAYKLASKAKERGETDLFIYRAYFLGSFLAGVLLVLTSAFFWIYDNMKSQHMLDIIVRDVPQNIVLRVRGHDYFVRRPECGPDYSRCISNYTEHMVVVQDDPFLPGATDLELQIFECENGTRCNGGVSSARRVPVRYDGNGPIDVVFDQLLLDEPAEDVGVSSVGPLRFRGTVPMACRTPAGSCVIATSRPSGSSCWCNLAVGPVVGSMGML